MDRSPESDPPRPVAHPRQEMSATGLYALARRHGGRDGDGPSLFFSYATPRLDSQYTSRAS
jgi:hypothetical protein